MVVPNKIGSHTAGLHESVMKDVQDSGCLGKSKRQLRLLEYLLTHETSSITQYSIALDVIGRSETFDPNIDSIVRVEMHRLRANLKTYNVGNYDYLITIPPSSFDVLVETRKQSLSTQLGKKSISIVVASLLAITTFCLGYAIPKKPIGADDTSVATRCSEVIPNISVSNVGSASDMQVYVEKVMRSTIAQQTGFNLANSGQVCRSSPVPAFNVKYALVEQADIISVAISVFSDRTNKLISSYHLTGDGHDHEHAEIGGEFELYYELVKVANSIAMPDSLLARAALTENWSSIQYRDNYRCITDMYDSFSGGADKEIQSVHQCLQDAKDSEYTSLDNYGALAASYLELARDFETPEASAPFKLAEKIIGEQQDFWFKSAELAIAILYYEIQRPDFNGERLDSILSDMEVNYSTNPQVSLMVAWLYGYSLGDWEKAKSISDGIKRIYAIQDQSVFIVDAGYALMHLDGKKAMADCSKFYAESSIYMNVIINACARKAGDADWFEITEKNLIRLNAVQTDQKMTVFGKLKHDFIFSKNVKTMLETPYDL